MEISEKLVEGVVVLELAGKVMGGPDATLLNDKLYELIEKGLTNVVANLENVDLMNSSGLGILISGLSTMKNTGGNLKLAKITSRIQNMLMITKLISVFETFETVEKAIASYKN